jgi:hypothetical protein
MTRPSRFQRYESEMTIFTDLVKDIVTSRPNEIKFSYDYGLKAIMIRLWTQNNLL